MISVTKTVARVHPKELPGFLTLRKAADTHLLGYCRGPTLVLLMKWAMEFVARINMCRVGGGGDRREQERETQRPRGQRE